MSAKMSTSIFLAITGNTYPVKDKIKALGGRWNAAGKFWVVPEENAEEAQALVPAAATRKSNYSPSYRGRRTGCGCGSIEDYPRESDCAWCQHDSD